jgi:hypothetical protein
VREPVTISLGRSEQTRRRCIGYCDWLASIGVFVQAAPRSFGLTALAYNLRRVLNIVEFPALMAALRA